MQGEEDHLMTQWTQKKQVVEDELCQIEQQLEQFSQPPSDDGLGEIENEAMLEKALNDINDVS